MDLSLENILLGVDDGVANMQLPDPALRDHYRNEADRVYWLNGEITNESLDLARMIVRWNEEDDGVPDNERQPIKIFIDSVGGDVTAAAIIVQAIRMSRTRVITINFCMALSAAAHILAAGHERLSFPFATVMLHNGSCQYSGNVDQVESAKKYYDKLSKRFTDVLLGCVNITPQTYKRRTSSDWYITDAEALEYGIVDRVIESLDEII